MIKTTVYTPDGSKSGQAELPEALFAAKINSQLMAQAVRVYLANQRKATAKSKTRGEVVRTTRKWYRQKGTGRARHGAQSAPLFVGGAKAHGPRGRQNYHLTMPQKMRRAALASALTSKFQAEELMIVDGLEKLSPKTKNAAQALFKLKLADQSKLTLITPHRVENITRAFRNLPTVSLEYANQLHAYGVLNGGILVLTKEALSKLTETFLPRKAGEPTKTETKTAAEKATAPSATTAPSSAKTSAKRTISAKAQKTSSSNPSSAQTKRKSPISAKTKASPQPTSKPAKKKTPAQKTVAKAKTTTKKSTTKTTTKSKSIRTNKTSKSSSKPKKTTAKKTKKSA